MSVYGVGGHLFIKLQIATTANDKGISIRAKPNSNPYTNVNTQLIQNPVQNSHRCQPFNFMTVNKLKAIKPIMTDKIKNSVVDIMYNQI